MPEQPAAATRALTPQVLAWLGALTAAVVPLVQFINGYWQNQLKQTEIAHQIALDFAKLAIADKASREYRRDTLKVIASIQGNPLQAWADTELKDRGAKEQVLLDAMRSRVAGRQDASLAGCKAHLEQQLNLLNHLIADTLDRKDVKDTMGVAGKDEYTKQVDRECRELELASKGVVVASTTVATPAKVGTATPTATQAAGKPAEEAVCAKGDGRPLDQLSAAKLARIYPRAQAADIATFLPLLRKALARAEIDTCARVAMFLAQIGHESSELRFTQETLSGEAYEGRKDLGNTQAGDGVRFKGRGLLIIVGRENYQRFSTALNRPDVMTHPELVANDPELALETAVWYWTLRKLNEAADRDDLSLVTKRISGGLNGLESRRAYLKVAQASL